jgi:hypothetical protein
MGAAMSRESAPPATWKTYPEAIEMLFRGATVPSASRIALVVGTWLSLVNQGDLLLGGTIPWFTVLLNYATPFAVASLGFLAARRRSNVERLVALLESEARRNRDSPQAPS